MQSLGKFLASMVAQEQLYKDISDNVTLYVGFKYFGEVFGLLCLCLFVKTDCALSIPVCLWVRQMLYFLAYARIFPYLFIFSLLPERVHTILCWS